MVAFWPNGAGKSTTMKLLTGYLAPSAGQAFVAGHNMASDRLAGPRVGLPPGKRPSLSRHVAPRPPELLRRCPRAERRQKRDQIDAVIDLCPLHAVIGKPIGKLSRGYGQRLGWPTCCCTSPTC